MTGLDDSSREVVHLVALEDGTKGMIVGGENGRMVVGMSEKDGSSFKATQIYRQSNILIDNEGKLVWEQRNEARK